VRIHTIRHYHNSVPLSIATGLLRDAGCIAMVTVRDDVIFLYDATHATGSSFNKMSTLCQCA